MTFKFGRWMTGYTYIEKALDRGLEDPEVNAIAFDIDSGGGMVSGNFELVEKIAAARGQKPMRAFASDHAFSAAYNIAAAADTITVARSGGVGSVGVLTAHVDVSKAMDRQGIKITLIYAGKHKVDGNPYEELPKDVKARIQERIDRAYGEFVGLVAANRGMTEQAVRDTEALTYEAADAVEVGFADKIGAMETEMAAFAEEAATREPTMANSNTQASGDNGGTFTQADLDKARADGVAEGKEAGASAERDRINTILGSDEAKTRPAAAMLMVDLGVAADKAAEKLAKMPEETKAEEAPKGDDEANGGDGTQTQAKGGTGANPTPFGQNMSGPKVGAELEGEGGEGGEDDVASQMLGALAMATGKRRRKAS
jgi:signal peptide peptidase SppA